MRTGVRSWSRWARIPEQHSQDIRRVWLLLLGYALQMSTSEYPPMWMRLRGGSRTPGWAAGLDSSPATHTSPLFFKKPHCNSSSLFSGTLLALSLSHSSYYLWINDKHLSKTHPLFISLSKTPQQGLHLYSQHWRGKRRKIPVSSRPFQYLWRV